MSEIYGRIVSFFRIFFIIFVTMWVFCPCVKLLICTLCVADDGNQFVEKFDGHRCEDVEIQFFAL